MKVKFSASLGSYANNVITTTVSVEEALDEYTPEEIENMSDDELQERLDEAAVKWAQEHFEVSFEVLEDNPSKEAYVPPEDRLASLHFKNDQLGKLRSAYRNSVPLSFVTGNLIESAQVMKMPGDMMSLVYFSDATEMKMWCDRVEDLGDTFLDGVELDLRVKIKSLYEMAKEYLTRNM